MAAVNTENSINTGIFARRLSQRVHDVPLSVLVVDDDELERELIVDNLSRLGFEVAQASNGEQALEVLEKGGFPVLIVDWQMPVMDGIAFTETLRASGHDETYIIMLTARDSNFDYDRGYLAGVDDYLSKKLPETELHSRLHSAFNTVGLRREVKNARARISELERRSG